jgi:hypothetical protein
VRKEVSMSKAKKGDEDDVTEIFEIDPSRIDGVGQAATRLPFLLIKSVAPAVKRKGSKPTTAFGRNAGRKLSPVARAAFAQNAEAVRAGKRPQKGKADKRRRGAGRVASKAASTYSSEIPATGPGESASIQAVLTGEQPGGMCSARTMNGAPCRRPAVAGGKCHFHA